MAYADRRNGARARALDVAPSIPDCMSPVQTTPRPLVMLTVCFLAVGLWQIGEGSWIYAKARLAQVLLQRAWSQTLAGHMQVKPWPWADTWPVGRLRVPSEADRCDRVEWRAMAGPWPLAPAFAESSSLPGAGGTTVLTGHRDTHFAFVGRLKEMDEILIDTPDGHSLRYRVLDSAIVDARTDAIRLADDKRKRSSFS